MKTARFDGSTTQFRPPELSPEDQTDVTLVRGRAPIVMRPAADLDDADLDNHQEAEESPIARLFLSQERSHAAARSRVDTSTPKRAKGLPVTVLTNDAAFASQVRTAMDNGADVTAVATVEEAAALATSKRCPILITDTSLARSAIEALTARLRALDPGLVFIIAGNRDHGGMLIGLQSSGAVDGFLLKPVTAGATQVVVESATKRYRAFESSVEMPSEVARTGRSRTRSSRTPHRALTQTDAIELATPTVETQVSVRPDRTVAPTMPNEHQPAKSSIRPSWPLLIAAVAVVGGLVWWGMSQRLPDIDPQRVIAEQLALAQAAQQSGRLIGPRASAASHYQAVLAMDPQNLTAQRGMDRVAAELSRQTQASMSQEAFAEAAVTLERLRELQPDYAELPLLDSQLQLLRDKVLASHTPPPASPVAAPAPRAEASAPVRPKVARTSERQRLTTQVREVKEAAVEPQRSASTSRPIIAPQPSSPQTVTSAPATARASEPLPESTPGPASTPSPIAATPRPQPATPSASTSIEEPRATATEISAAPTQTPTVAANVMPIAPVAPTPNPTATPQPATPTLQKYVPPVFPSEAYARGIEGWVQLTLTVSPQGSVVTARIDDGEKRQLFSRAALAAVKQWRYEPRPPTAGVTDVSVRLDFQIRR